MKARLLTIVSAVAVGLASSSGARADTTDPTAVAADVLIGRPMCFVATVVGSAIFVVSLPVAATSKSVKSAAEALVLTPARATFKRPLGDFSYTDEMTKREWGEVEQEMDVRKNGQ